MLNQRQKRFLKAEAEAGREEPPKPLLDRLLQAVAQADRALFYFRGLRSPVWRFLGRVFRGFGFRHLCCQAVLGTGDPALTGQVCG